MSYALFLDGHITAGPFATKSKCWDDATKRGLVRIVPSLDEDPPRRMLDFKYAILTVSAPIPTDLSQPEPVSAAV